MDHSMGAGQDGIVKLVAEALWTRDYPRGGSIYKTYLSTPWHDQSLYEDQARAMLEAAAPQQEGAKP
jgi:hypothetical protein